MGPQPFVSVVVLNFNGAAIVGRCLDHLLAQTYPRFEIIVVDNGSSDESLEVLDRYLSRGNVSVVRSHINRGVAGGRNLGLRYATGEVVAFLDNDAYASPAWLDAAVRTLDGDSSIGAVASLVFFNRHKIILNGAGGTVNYRGYGGDWCFNAPYEFAELPDEVLYPMGCGMVVRRAVLDVIAPLDGRLLNYYDDVEVGMRTWSAGWRVVLSPDAWVDHDYGYSNRFNRQKVLLCERGRVRTALKYFPVRHLVPWLLHEVKLLNYVRDPALRRVPLAAWGWNLLHLPSALRCRFRYRAVPRRFWSLLHRSWDAYPPPMPSNDAVQPDPTAAGPHLLLDGHADAAQLVFGWYPAEADGTHAYRWTTAAAAALFRLDRPATQCALTCRAAGVAPEVTLSVRPFGTLDLLRQLTVPAPPLQWQERLCGCELPPGLYELIVRTAPTQWDMAGRQLGLAVAAIHFR